MSDAFTFLTMSRACKGVRRFSANPQQRVRTGIESLDLMIEGPASGEVLTIIAASGVGKSHFAINMMARNADVPMVFFSLEMPSRQVVQRLWSVSSNVDAHTVQEQIKRNTLPEAFDDLGEKYWQHAIVDNGGRSISDMAVTVAEFETYMGVRPRVILVDYLELVRGAQGEGWQATEENAREFKAFSKAEDLAVVLLHQVNRTGSKEWEPPNQYSARGGGYTEADVMVGMWKPYSDPNYGQAERALRADRIDMNVIKNRINGRLTTHPIQLRLSASLRLLDERATEERKEAA